MGRRSKPKAGSLGYYPRVRAKNIVAKFKTFKEGKDVKILNFYGYKVGMAHVMAVNKHKGSALLNQKMAIPSTIVEFPSLNVFGIRFYNKPELNKSVMKEFLFYDKAGKELPRRIKGSDKNKSKGDLLKIVNDFFNDNEKRIVDIKMVTHTNPSKTTIGKKVPEVVELSLSGSIKDKFNFIKDRLGKEVNIEDAFKDGSFLDVKAVTIGKGFEGSIKRYGIKRRSHKAEKGQRKVGTIGAWNPSLVMWTTPRPGQMGFHTRTVYNLKLLKVEKPENMNRPGGWEGYGVVRNNVAIISGAIPGPVKRIITIRDSIRPYRDIKTDINEIEQIVL